MALAHGYALPFEALRRTGVLAQNTADATNRATADGATKEAAGSCLDARALEVQQRTVVQPSILVVPQLTRNGVVLTQLPDTRTNFIQNNTMTGATGSVRPNLWDLGSLPSGFTVSYSASGQTTAADGTLVDYIDVTVSGTALASGFLNLRQTTSPSPVSGNLLFASGMTYTASVYLALLSGSLTGVATNAMALQEIANTTFVANTTFAPVTGITSALTRFTGTRTMDATGGADRTSVRWGHSIVSGTSYDYTVRIASPQLEKGSVATPVIRTASGFVTVDMLGIARDGAPPDFTFTRATTATRVNASGLIESVASGLLRLDYPVTGGCPAALIEASGQNTIINSQNFTSGSAWAGGVSGLTLGLTISGDTVAAPDNTTTADTFTLSLVGGSHLCAQYNRWTGVQQTFSIYVKPNTASKCYIGNASQSIYAYFDLTSGVLEGIIGSGMTAAIEPAPNGYYRCSVTHTSNSTLPQNYRTAAIGIYNTFVSGDAAQTNVFTPTSADSLYVWGAQMELGAIPTSYIATTTAAATRNADVCSVSGVSGYIGQTEGTIYAEVQISNFTANNRILAISDGTSNARVILQEAANSVIQGIVTTASADVASISTASGQTAGTYKVALAYKADDFAMYVNGTQIGTDTAGAVPACSQIFLGKIETSATTNQLGDRLRAAAIYTTRLTNDQLANLTRLT